MTTLEEKLREIQRGLIASGGGLDDYGRDVDEENKTADESIEQIKQAFIDHGWIKTTTTATSGYVSTKPTWVKVPDDGKMTGQEWETKALADGWRRPE